MNSRSILSMLAFSSALLGGGSAREIPSIRPIGGSTTGAPSFDRPKRRKQYKTMPEGYYEQKTPVQHMHSAARRRYLASLNK